MKIKAKITVGVGLLFVLIILQAGVSIRQVSLWTKDTKNVLKANYNSLEYARIMLDAIGNSDLGNDERERFDSNLALQELNVTESGEEEMTQNLRRYYENWRKNPKDSLLLEQMRGELNEIMQVNLDAIRKKDAIAEKTADNAVFWLSVIGTFCFLIAFVLVFNLPANIADPIQELTQRIKNIAAGDYSQRVHFKSGSEFGELASSFNTMAEKLSEYNNSNLARLMTEKRRIETLINNMHDPVIGLDEENKILFANEEALKISGLTAKEVLGKPALELSVNNDLIRSLMQEILAGKNQNSVQANAPLKIFADGKESYFEKEIVDIAVTPTGEKQPRHIGYVILLRNITVYKELDSAKTNFIATISHEFKTPISSIKMSLQLLENGRIGTMNEEQAQLITGIRDDTERLLRITGELLNMTQVETGNIQLSVIPSDPKWMITRAIEANKTTADQKNIRFQTSIAADDAQVLADADKTTWVLTNLISNALRYSYDNSTVFLGVQDLGEQLEFSVRDTGQGIPPQYVQKVFDRYFRVPGVGGEGTGLGLAISKEFVEAQGGKISVESDLGAGTTFKIWLQKAKKV